MAGAAESGGKASTKDAATLDDDGHLLIGEFGVFLGLHSERLQLSRKGQKLLEAPLVKLSHVLVLSGGVSLSSNAIRECCLRGIPITFLDGRGDPYATLLSPKLTGTVRTRREQLLAYGDARGVHLSLCFARGKLGNQVNLLRYVAKYRKVRSPESFERVRERWLAIEDNAGELDRLRGEKIDDIRGEVLSIEGRAAQHYWEGVRELLVDEHDWPGREGRGAGDLINSLLNYGYGILSSKVQQALVLAGLDPFAGFLHADRAGKHSLVYDLIEEFRQAVVDRAVLAMLNLRSDLGLEDGKLNETTRKTVAAKVLERLEQGAERYEGKKRSLRAILNSQARHIATYVRGDGKPYAPFIASW
ncbi:MAG: CRISPR-associated endonuclease Cas1 [Chloroflexota bacterium]